MYSFITPVLVSKNTEEFIRDERPLGKVVKENRSHFNYIVKIKVVPSRTINK